MQLLRYLPIYAFKAFNVLWGTYSILSSKFKQTNLGFISFALLKNVWQYSRKRSSKDPKLEEF